MKSTKWGIYDTQDNCWIGNDQGPLQFEDEQLGRAAATLYGQRCRQMIRFQCRVMPEKNFTYKDTFTPPTSGTQAVVELEAGRTIDPVCIIHGKKMSEHHCLYCCLCFEPLTPEQCNVLPDGKKEDVCISCAEKEKQYAQANPNIGGEEVR